MAAGAIMLRGLQCVALGAVALFTALRARWVVGSVALTTLAVLWHWPGIHQGQLASVTLLTALHRGR
jgi:hypothetical protein